VSAPGEQRFVVASANPDKVAEIAAVLEPLGVQLDPRPASVPDVVEDAPTLEANARLKAVAIARATDQPAMADDTGLEVDALHGAPGVRSARYAGEHVTYADNVRHLLAELERVGAVTPDDRRARFRTVALVRWPDGREVSVSGVVEGRISDVPRGDGGFGYDPVFVPDEGGGLTFAEMAPSAKHAISHRGRAFRGLADALAASAAPDQG
jgi:XTP/dITP diphosphohydrolase